MSPAGTPQGSAHHDVEKPAAKVRDDVQIDPATGEIMGGWTLPPALPQPEADEPEPPPVAPVPVPDVEAAPAPRPQRDSRLDHCRTALERAMTRPQLEHLDGIPRCRCLRCWQRRGSIHKSNRRVGPSRAGESAASWNHRADERPTGSASEQVQEVLDTEF